MSDITARVHLTYRGRSYEAGEAITAKLPPAELRALIRQGYVSTTVTTDDDGEDS